MKNTFLISLFLLTAISITTAQRFLPAEIYTIDGKTTAGFIKKNSVIDYSKSIEFKTTTKNKVKTYQTTQLKGFKINKQATYESVVVQLPNTTKRTVFLQVLVDGETNLYRLEVDVETAIKMNGQEVSYLLKRDSESNFLQLTEGNYKSQIKEHFVVICGDKVENAIDNYLYVDNGLARMVESYNVACFGEQSSGIRIDLDRNKKKLTLIGGIGLMQTEIRGNSPRLADFAFENGIGINLHFLLQAPIVQRLSFQFGVDYQEMSSRGKSQFIVNEFYTNAGEIIDLESNINFQFIHPIANLKYRILPKKFSPYIYGGIHYGFGLSNKVFLERPVLPFGNGENIATKELDEEPFGIIALGIQDYGWQAGIGIDYQLSEKIILYATYHYQQGTNIPEEGFSLIFENTVQGINAGIQF